MARIEMPENFTAAAVETSSAVVSLIARDAGGEVWRVCLTPSDDLSALTADVRTQIMAAWTPERLAAFAAAAVVSEPEPVMSVPASITPYQARRALNAAGLRAAVEAAVAGASYDVQDAWEYGLSVERSSPLIAAMAASLSLSAGQVDELFLAAAQY